MERVKHKSIFWLCPLRHLLGLVGAVLIVLHRLLRGNTALMRSLSARFVRPTLQRMGQRSAMLPFSLAELLIVLLVLGALGASGLPALLAGRCRAFWPRAAVSLLMLAGSLIVLIGDTYNPFLYFRF